MKTGPWQRLVELSFGAFPDDTGMLQKLFPQIKGQEYPYEDGGLENEPQDATDVHGWSHNVPTPSDPRHTAWAEKHDGDGEHMPDADDDAEEAERQDEAGGLPQDGARASAGGMGSSIPGGAKFGGNPFDREVDDDEVEKMGHVKEKSEEPVDDDELERFLSAMGSEQEPANFPGSELPSDILAIAGGGEFAQGLGHALGKGRDLYGIRDGAGELPVKTAWSYLETLVVRENSSKK